MIPPLAWAGFVVVLVSGQSEYVRFGHALTQSALVVDQENNDEQEQHIADGEAGERQIPLPTAEEIKHVRSALSMYIVNPFRARCFTIHCCFIVCFALRTFI